MTKARRVLLHLAKGDDYGLRIAKGTGIAMPYPTLRELEQNGLVFSFEGDSVAARRGRSRIYYRLTTAGWSAVLEAERSRSSDGEPAT
ncbi:MAG: helix-turn-helix transcriptional regulator [Myxococcota bacterium]